MRCNKKAPSARVILEWSRPTGFFALLKNDSVGRRSEGSRADCFRLAIGKRAILESPLHGLRDKPNKFSTPRSGSAPTTTRATPRQPNPIGPSMTTANRFTKAFSSGRRGTTKWWMRCSSPLTEPNRSVENATTNGADSRGRLSLQMLRDTPMKFPNPR